MVIENICPVCGFQMDEPPKDYNICPSCGTEFGVNDVNASVEELRAAWIQSGPKWWSPTDPQPADWNPFAQLAEINCSSAVVTGEPTFILKPTSTTSSSTIEIKVTEGLAGAAVSWVLVPHEDTQLAKVA